MKPHVFHPAADEEYAEAARYYARIDPELGRRFYEQIELLIHEIRCDAQRFPLFDPPIRRHFDRVFPYAVLCADQPERVFVVAVMDMRRKPGYWQKRLS